MAMILQKEKFAQLISHQLYPLNRYLFVLVPMDHQYLQSEIPYFGFQFIGNDIWIGTSKQHFWITPLVESIHQYFFLSLHRVMGQFGMPLMKHFSKLLIIFVLENFYVLSYKRYFHNLFQSFCRFSCLVKGILADKGYRTGQNLFCHKFWGKLSHFLSNRPTETPPNQHCLLNLEIFAQFNHILSPISKVAAGLIVGGLSESSKVEGDDSMAKGLKIEDELVPPLMGGKVSMDKDDGFWCVRMGIFLLIEDILSIWQGSVLMIHPNL